MTSHLSFIERLSSLRRLRRTSIIEKGPRLSSLWRLKCTSMIEKGHQSVFFTERYLFKVSIIRSSTEGPRATVTCMDSWKF